MPPDRTPRQSEHFYNEYKHKHTHAHTLYHFVSIYRLCSLKVFWSFFSFCIVKATLPSCCPHPLNLSRVATFLLFCHLLSLILVGLMTWPQRGCSTWSRVLSFPLCLQMLLSLCYTCHIYMNTQPPYLMLSMICQRDVNTMHIVFVCFPNSPTVL